ncbi:MAG: hypothetical protein OEM79_05900, partial [Nitrosopumilus sp.]|nr:hypothetical protein [Nitrosopumilus sp.]
MSLVKFSTLVVILFSIGLSPAFAEDDWIINPDNISFGKVPEQIAPKQTLKDLDSQLLQNSDIKSDYKETLGNDDQTKNTDKYIIDPKLLKNLPKTSLPPPVPYTNPLTGDASVLSGHYIMYSPDRGNTIKSDAKQLVENNGQQFYLVPSPLDTTANAFAILILAVPFGLIVYRISDEDPIPQKFQKLASVTLVFSMASMLTMPIAVGNSMWGYAFAQSDLEKEIIPKPVDFVYFDNSNNFITNGATIISDQENSVISLDGKNDYLILDSNLSDRLNEFTVSAWVKPDYKKGAPATLSIVSEAAAFDLSINNDNVEKNIAIFSVYDGIKWHQIQSNSAIPENWTHISATYSNNEIRIYVNGFHENYKKIDGGYSSTYQYGNENQNTRDYIPTNADILIGAFNPSLREQSNTENHFSGYIDDVTLYDQSLTMGQISTLDENNRMPDIILQSETQTVQTEDEQTGTPNEYGFVADENNTNDQNIEESASEGYKVKKSEDRKKEEAGKNLFPNKHDAEVSTSSSTSTEPESVESELPIPDTNDESIEPEPTDTPPPESTGNVTEFTDGEITTLSDSSVISEPEPTEPEPTEPEPTEPEPTEPEPTEPEPTEPEPTDSLTEFTNGNVTTSSDSSTVAAFETSNDVMDSTLTHAPIEIGKDVQWQQTVLFSNETSMAEIEIPSDASLSRVITSDDQEILLATIYESDKSPSSAQSKVAMVDFIPEIIQNKSDTKLISIPSPSDGVVIEFTTGAAGISENILKESSNSFEKHVTVSHDSALHYSDVLTQSDIPEAIIKTIDTKNLRLLWIDENGQAIDVTKDPQYDVTLVDTDDNGIPDKLQWSVPQLSEQSFVILITAAEHLDSDRNFIADVYDLVSAIDQIYLEDIPEGDYIRTTFEVPISNVNFIDVFAKANITTSSQTETVSGFVEIYEVDSDELIATIGPISEEKMYSAQLTGLSGFQDVFDLKVVGTPIDIDYIQDAVVDNLEQCRNGPLPDPPEQCIGANWQSGNLGPSHSQYAETDYVPFRINLNLDDVSDAPTTDFSLIIQYGIIHTSSYAYDFLGTYNNTETDANPCVIKVGGNDVTVCDINAGSYIAIPSPIKNTDDYDDDGTPEAGPIQPKTFFDSEALADPSRFVFSLFPENATDNVNLTSAEFINVPGFLTEDLHIQGSSTADATIRINFTANDNATDAVLSWSGHVASSNQWGFDTTTGESITAAGKSGSPYHMRVLQFNDDNIGQQDRSLKVDAVEQPIAAINITKVTLDGDGSFNFTTDEGLSNQTGIEEFTLTTPGSDTQNFFDLFSGNYTVTEEATPGWELVAPIECASVTGNSTFTPTVDGLGINITLDNPQGIIHESTECTFTNQAVANLTLKKTTLDGNAETFQFAINATDTTNVVPIGDNGTGSTVFHLDNGTHRIYNVTTVGAGTMQSIELQKLNATTYEITELIDDLDEWVFDSSSCTNSGETPFTGTSGTGEPGDPLIIDLEAADDVICSFYNKKSADLQVTKTSGFEPAIAGETLWYTINVTNAGPAQAENVFLNDTLPDDTTFVSSNVTPTGATNSTFAEWDLGTILAGESVFINVTIALDPSIENGTILLNDVSVNSTTFDPDPDNNDDTEETESNTIADLLLVKSDNGTNAVAGENYTYTVNVTNNGPSDAQNVTITDTLPLNTTFVSASDGGTNSTNLVTWPTIPTLEFGDSVQYTVTTLVGADVLDGAVLLNIANVTSDTEDDNPNNNGDDEPTTVDAIADLLLEKSDNGINAVAGENYTYTINVTNTGPSDAQNVTITDTLPLNTTFVSSDPTRNVTASDATTTVWPTITTLAAGDSLNYTITVFVIDDVLDGTVLLNIANVTSDTEDDNPDNNGDDEQTTVNATADLEITKIANVTDVVPGETFNYTITVTNNGPSLADNVTVTDVLPANVTFVDATPDQVSLIDGVLTWFYGEIAVDGVETIEVQVTVDANTTTTQTNDVNVTSDTIDQVDDNNNDTVNTP